MFSPVGHVPAGIMLNPAVCVCVRQLGGGARPANNTSQTLILHQGIYKTVQVWMMWLQYFFLTLNLDMLLEVIHVKTCKKDILIV